MKVYEFVNRKTGISYIDNEDVYKSLKESGRLKKFFVTEIEPIRKLVPIPGILKPEIKITKSKVKK
jgi:hypothetical protein